MLACCCPAPGLITMRVLMATSNVEMPKLHEEQPSLMLCICTCQGFDISWPPLRRPPHLPGKASQTAASGCAALSSCTEAADEEDKGGRQVKAGKGVVRARSTRVYCAGQTWWWLSMHGAGHLIHTPYLKSHGPAKGHAWSYSLESPHKHASNMCTVDARAQQAGNRTVTAGVAGLLRACGGHPPSPPTHLHFPELGQLQLGLHQLLGD